MDNEEEIERTRMMKSLFIDSEDYEESVLERIEEFEDRVEYLDYDEEKKEKLIKLCNEIKKEEDENVQKYLFNMLQEEIK